jgi:hypothetical protein
MKIGFTTFVHNYNVLHRCSYQESGKQMSKTRLSERGKDGKHSENKFCRH